MKTPVLIAAYDEEALIGRALRGLDSSAVEPWVLVNGSTDGTASVAESFGATTVVLEEQGKLPAIQEGLKLLGSRALLPVILLDADSAPAFPRVWENSIVRTLLREEGPSSVSGLTALGGRSSLENFIRTAKRFAGAVKASRANSTDATFGANLGIKLDNAEVFEAVLALPHIWPGEDRAIVDTIRSKGGTFRQSINPLTLVRMSSRSYPSLGRRLRLGAEAIAAEVSEDYSHRTPPGATMVYDGDGKFVPIHDTETDSGKRAL